MNDIDNGSTLGVWTQTRQGAWSGRGFHFQHLFSTLILVRQWAGLAPAGYLVPEGEEDCVVELSEHNVWIQIKSKKNGAFSKRGVEGILADVKQKAARTSNQKTIQFAVGLEQPCTGVPEQGIDKLFEGEGDEIVVCKEPETEIVNLLSQKLSVLEEIAEVLARDLYWLVADSAAANASRTFGNRRRISTTEIGRRIHRYLEANNPSAITHAFESGALGPVDFVTQVSEPGFYQGIKVRPGHLAAGLVLDRPTEKQAIVKELKSQRHLLITGPSGAGKSALMWLVANVLESEFRWYQVSARAGANHADSIARSIRACRPNDSSPIGLTFDEVGPSNSEVWNILANELRELPDVYLLGTVRNEDIPLLSNQPDTGFFEVSLSESLAQSVWQKLTSRGQTEWQHWLEPYELSDGLMLEYVHILTQGQRLAAVIGEQVRKREQEGRCAELAIIRGSSALSSLGGEIEAGKLFDILELPPDRASVALQRLLDEHLVRESRPGVLGGLHSLRSQALSHASHDETVYLRTDSLWRVLLAATNETLPRVIQSALKEGLLDDETEAVQKLAEVLADNDDVELWTAILIGLGLGTLERRVASFIAILEEHGVQPALWSAASMFALIDGDMPESTLPAVRKAVLAFKEASHCDLRTDCLATLPQETESPTCIDLRQANRLLSCLVPLVGGESIPNPFVLNISSDAAHDIREIAGLLSTAYAVAPEMAQNLALKWGDEQTLLARYHAQTAWTTTPVVEPKGEHGRTVRANLLYIDEEYQADPHETIFTICEALLALSPNSDAVASDVIDPSGQPVQMGDFRFGSKNIPRQNVTAKARAAWNVVFRQILLARAADGLTEYTHQMAHLVRKTENLFRSFTEQWIREKRIQKSLNTNISDVASAVNRLSYAAPEDLPAHVTANSIYTNTEIRLGALLTNVLTNLVPRMAQVEATGNAKAPATYAGNRSALAREYVESAIWRTTSTPPLRELTALADRLFDVSCILHEMAYSFEAAKQIARTAQRKRFGKAVPVTASRCLSSARNRFNQTLQAVERALQERGWNATIWTRPINENDSPYWPAAEVAVTVDIEGFDTDIDFFTDCFSVGKEILAGKWRFCVVPVINGHVIPAFAFVPLSPRPLPDNDFESKWEEHIDLPFFSSELAHKSDAFDAAVSNCMQISAIVHFRDLANLYPEEEIVLSRAVDDFERNGKVIGAFAEESGLEELLFATSFLNDIWNRVVSEHEAAQTGKTIDTPLCMIPYNAMAGEENEEINDFAAMRMLLRQTECRIVTT